MASSAPREGAAIIPGRHLADVEAGFRELVVEWPSENGEIKGRLLSEKHFEQLCAFLASWEVLFECSVMDMGTATEAQVSNHRAAQAEAMTSALTPEHRPELIADVRRLRTVLEQMPLQLYSQLVTLTHVTWRSLGHGMLYFCQRMPGELGRLRWLIDAKNESITRQEEWWRICMKPLLQTRSIREPIVKLKGGDYSSYRRNFPSIPVPKYLRDKLPPGTKRGDDLSAVFAEMEFADSREHVGLQIADALTNCARRALTGNLQPEGWRLLRNLMINHRNGAIRLISLGDGDTVRDRPYAGVARELMSGGRSMVVER